MDNQERSIKYGIYMGRRYKEKEKTLFLQEVAQEFQAMSYEAVARKTSFKRFSGVNLYVGDLVNAKNLVIAHYDTPLNSFDKKMVFNPFNIRATNRNQEETPRRYALFAIVVGMTLMMVLTFFTSIRGNLYNGILIAITAAMTAVGYIIIRGVGNPINTNFNTSGVLAVLEIAAKHPADTAFVLTDRECIDNLGDVMLNDALPKTLRDKRIIHLRALGSGSSIVVAHTVENTGLAHSFKHEKVSYFQMEEVNMYQHSLGYYEKAVSITVADKFENDWEVHNVFNNQDLEIDWDMYNEVVNLVSQWLKAV